MSQTREQQILDFLKKNYMDKMQRYKLSSDASFRRYERLNEGKKTLMLMDAPPDKENIEPFVNIDNYLIRRGFSAPKIYASDSKHGFILLEDLGDESYTKVLSGNSPFSKYFTEKKLYTAAIDVLIQLSRSTLPQQTPDYDGELLMKECKLFIDWYLPNVNPQMNTQIVKDEYMAIWEKLLSFDRIAEDTVVLRDYHADNLMWLPERAGVENVGLLDFQDAVIGSPVYDIVSLLEDARRDVATDTVDACIEHYLSYRKLIKREDFLRAYAVLAAQRNCKIVGIFARLANRDGKQRYINYLPRVWKHLEKGLGHSALTDLKKWMDIAVPEEMRLPEKFQFMEVVG